MGDDADGSEADNGVAEERLAKLEEENRSLRSELDEAKSEIAVTGCVRENLVELERQKTSVETELETMRQLLTESHDESTVARTVAEHELAKTQAVVDQLQVENHELRFGSSGGDPKGILATSSDAVGSLDKETILGGAAVLSDATKSFARRMKSNLMPDKSPSGGGVAAAGPTILSPVKDQAAVENVTMRQAYEDTELLKAIVVPLEEQIGALKDKLREADSLLREHEKRQSDSLLGVDALAKWLQGHSSVEEAMAALIERSNDPGLDNTSELYVSLLSARFSILNSEFSGVRRDRDDVSSQLERERAANRALRTEAAIADSEAIRVQRESLVEMARIRSVLTEEQKTEIVAKRRAAAAAALSSSSKAAAEASLPTEHKLSETAKSDSGSYDAPLKGSEEPKNCGDTRSADTSPDSSPLHISSSQSGGGPADIGDLSSPLAAADAGIVAAAVAAAAAAAAASSSGGGYKTVSQSEWDEMQREVRNVRSLLGVGDGESLVGSDAHARLRAELEEARKESAAHAKNEEKLKEDLAQEAVYRHDVEEKWNERAEGHKSETEALNKQIMEAEGLLEQLRMSYATMYEATRKDLKSLTADREKIVRELRRLQSENDILVGKHNAKSQEMAADAINLPEGAEEMQLMLLKLREDLIAAKVSEERARERLAYEVGLARNQLAGEQREREAAERRLTSETEELKRRCQHAERYKQDRDDERKGRAEAEEAGGAARRELEAARAERGAMERGAAEMRNRIGNLQQELDNSVAVQTDFVRLSQSLQMELEKIRQSEKEVRWQHEDDVAACQNCKSALSANRRKHHCRHCGRIFCSDCVTKTVASGPTGRPAKVCDVCHTLLVQNSAPYFSTEAPHN